MMALEKKDSVQRPSPFLFYALRAGVSVGLSFIGRGIGFGNLGLSLSANGP